MAYLRLRRAAEASIAPRQATCVIRLFHRVRHQPHLP